MRGLRSRRPAPAELQIDVYGTPDPERELADIRECLLASPARPSRNTSTTTSARCCSRRSPSNPSTYQTRTEHALLETVAPGIVERTGISELVELGAGNASKTRVLLDAMTQAGQLQLYVPFDFSEGMLRRVAGEIVQEYPGLRVHGVVADFTEAMYEIPRASMRVWSPSSAGRSATSRRRTRRACCDGSRRACSAAIWFLLGTDLVKDVQRLEAAYNDAAGVTAEFNKNVLRVLNARVGGNFDPERFRHRAFYNRRQRWIEMRLVSTVAQRVQLPAIDLELRLRAGEEIRTEISAKYDQRRVEALLERGGFDLVEWHTDPESLFALTLARRR
jgi:L-histidine N-alpha-methyltransferase